MLIAMLLLIAMIVMLLFVLTLCVIGKIYSRVGWPNTVYFFYCVYLAELYSIMMLSGMTTAHHMGSPLSMGMSCIYSMAVMKNGGRLL